MSETGYSHETRLSDGAEDLQPISYPAQLEINRLRLELSDAEFARTKLLEEKCGWLMREIELTTVLAYYAVRSVPESLLARAALCI